MKGIRMVLLQGLMVAVIVTAFGCRASNLNEVKNNKTGNTVDTSSNVGVNNQEQVRNNKLKYSEKTIGRFWKDSVFENFKDTGKNYEEYEQWLIKEAKGKDINDTKLIDCLKTAKKLHGDKDTLFPIIIDTANYNGKESFIFVFTWENTDMIKEVKTVAPLGHIFIVAIEADSKKIIAKESCK